MRLQENVYKECAPLHVHRCTHTCLTALDIWRADVSGLKMLNRLRESGISQVVLSLLPRRPGCLIATAGSTHCSRGQPMPGLIGPVANGDPDDRPLRATESLNATLANNRNSS